MHTVHDAFATTAARTPGADFLFTEAVTAAAYGIATGAIAWGAAAAEVEVEKNKAITANLGTVEQDVGMVQTGNREILQGADVILRNV